MNSKVCHILIPNKLYRKKKLRQFNYSQKNTKKTDKNLLKYMLINPQDSGGQAI